MKTNRYDIQRTAPTGRKAATPPKGSLERKLLAYSAAAGVVLAGVGAEEAQAQGTCNVADPNVTLNGSICYTDVNPDVVVPLVPLSFPIDFDGDAAPEFRLFFGNAGPTALIQNTGASPADYGYYGGVAGFNTPTRGPSASNPGALLPSDPINGALSFTGVILGFGAGYNFPSKGQRFIGVKMKLDNATTHPGWIRVAVAPGTTSLTVFDYAYQTITMAPILAGDTGAGVLPVELTTFEAATDADAVLLRWATASETNNAGFEIQHQRGGDWHAVGFVEGHGTTTAPQAYQHRLAGLEPGTHAFRLKQVDFDGAFDYSPVVEAAVEVPGTHALSSVYPNPFNPRASFTLAVQEAQQVRIALFDALGREAQVLHDGLLSGGETHRFEIAGGDLPSGFYLVRAIGERFEAVQPATLVK